MTYEVGDSVELMSIDEASLKASGIGYLRGMEDYVGKYATIKDVEIGVTSTDHTAIFLEFEDRIGFWVNEDCIVLLESVTNLSKFFEL